MTNRIKVTVHNSASVRTVTSHVKVAAITFRLQFQPLSADCRSTHSTLSAKFAGRLQPMPRQGGAPARSGTPWQVSSGHAPTPAPRSGRAQGSVQYQIVEVAEIPLLSRVGGDGALFDQRGFDKQGSGSARPRRRQRVVRWIEGYRLASSLWRNRCRRCIHGPGSPLWELSRSTTTK
jgi:hypothetical protein